MSTQPSSPTPDDCEDLADQVALPAVSTEAVTAGEQRNEPDARLSSIGIGRM
jgi:hypothetical protein